MQTTIQPERPAQQAGQYEDEKVEEVSHTMGFKAGSTPT